jgi:hypothetical protein
MTRITTTPATLAVNADYADALLTARRAKNTLFFLLLLILFAQITVFVLVRWDIVQVGTHRTDASAASATSDVSVGSPTTQATAEVTTQPSGVTVRAPGVTVRASNNLLAAVLEYVTDLSVFLGIILGIVLLVAVILMTLIMLVGRLIGVTHVTSAVVWAALLMAFLFPWQIFFNRGPERAADAMVGAMTSAANAPGMSLSSPSSSSSDAASVSRVPDFYIPGVLYTWDELVRGAHFPNTDMKVAVLKWARFVGFPVIAILILLAVQVKTGRGARFALGESDVQVEVSTPNA